MHPQHAYWNDYPHVVNTSPFQAKSKFQQNEAKKNSGNIDYKWRHCQRYDESWETNGYFALQRFPEKPCLIYLPSPLLSQNFGKDWLTFALGINDRS